MNWMVHLYGSAMRINMEAVNKLAKAESRAQTAQRERDEAVSKATAANLAMDEAEREAFVNKENAIKMAELNLKADSEVICLKRMLAEARGLRDSEVAQAAQIVRREVSEAFIPKFKIAEEKISLLDGVNDNQFMYLSQARANVQLIKALKDCRALATENDQVKEWLKHFADAEANLNVFIAELKEDLKALAPEPTPLSPGVHRSVENIADEAGVADQFGSLLPIERVCPSEEPD